MKKRNKFVSNSSSSSFIVKFPREPKSVEDVQQIVFGADEFIYSRWGDEKYSTKSAAEVIFNDIQNQKKNNVEQALDLVSQLGGGPRYEDYQKNGKVDWDAYHEAQRKYGEIEFAKFYSLSKIRKAKIDKLSGKDVSNTGELFYIFSFSDNDGDFQSVLEHGQIFDRLEYIYINQH